MKNTEEVTADEVLVQLVDGNIFRSIFLFVR